MNMFDKIVRIQGSQNRDTSIPQKMANLTVALVLGVGCSLAGATGARKTIEIPDLLQASGQEISCLASTWYHWEGGWLRQNWLSLYLRVYSFVWGPRRFQLRGYSATGKSIHVLKNNSIMTVMTVIYADLQVYST